MQWFAQAPANIALIKYMGKKDPTTNIPANPSLSYTLPNLLTNVMLETHAGKHDYWEPLHIPGAEEFNLSQAAQDRYLAFLSLLKQRYSYNGSFIVRSSNNFPHSSGLASSASSFAALTKGALSALCELTSQDMPPVQEQAELSRLASGSSCRSFFVPWAIWDENGVGPIELPYSELLHQVIVISHAVKEIPSSQAHKLITTSPDYAERTARAKRNLDALLVGLTQHNWVDAYEICWREFQDMHQLFTTCNQPFSYINEDCRNVLRQLQEFWEKEGDGPLVTMDAGPNIHLLYRPDQTELARRFHCDYLLGNHDVI